MSQCCADDDQLESHFLGDALESGGTHLARRTDRKTITGNQERLARVDACPEVGHQVPERSGLPPLVERIQTLGHAIGRRSDLVGVDCIKFFGTRGSLRIPEHERPPVNQASHGFARQACRLRSCGGRCRQRVGSHAGLQTGRLNRVHTSVYHSAGGFVALATQWQRRIFRKPRIGRRALATKKPRATIARDDACMRAGVVQSPGRVRPLRESGDRPSWRHVCPRRPLRYPCAGAQRAPTGPGRRTAVVLHSHHHERRHDTASFSRATGSYRRRRSCRSEGAGRPANRRSPPAAHPTSRRPLGTRSKDEHAPRGLRAAVIPSRPSLSPTQFIDLSYQHTEDTRHGAYGSWSFRKTEFVNSVVSLARVASIPDEG